MISVVGAGAIGKTISDYLSGNHEVAVVDLDAERLKKIKGIRRLAGTVDDHWEVLERSDVVLVALPGSVAFGVVKKLVSHGLKVVDISFSENDPMELQDLAEDNNALLIPDAGFAPGLSNILAGNLLKEGRYHSVEMYVAGLPQEKKPPLDYAVTWSVEGLIDEYTRPARIIAERKLREVDPLDDISCFHVEGLGDFEAFYSDGLRTLLDSDRVVNMFEKTLRYPGHLAKIRFLREMGFFSDKKVSGTTVRKVSEQVFEKLRTGEKDVCILIVRGIGKENREFFCIDRYDDKNGVSSMSRMTGYTASVIAEAVIEGKVDGKGVLPPENIGYNEEAFDFIRKKLASKGIIF